MKNLLIGLVGVFSFAISGFGQGYGSISGSVHDPSQAVIPNVSVIVINTATNVETKAVSRENGTFIASQLIPGPYRITAQADGFKRYVRDGVVVQVSDRITVDVQLELGATAESVVVTGEASRLRTEDAQSGEVVSNTFIASLPQLNRNPFDLLRLSGNVQGSETTGVQANEKSEIRINGGRTSSVEYFVDGAVVTTGRAHNLSNQTPSMDGVLEFKVVTNGVSAERGRISGGYVELVTKSGTNSFHGSAYEYMFNDMFNANAWDQNALGNRKVHFRQNNFGFTLGGPVMIPKLLNGRNKTFFFVDNEYKRRKQGGALVTRSIPTEAEQNGDFTNTVWQGLTTRMYDPFGAQRPAVDASGNPTGRWERTQLLGGDGKHVPASLISPVAKAIFARIPKPNRAPTAGTSSANNYAAPQESTLDTFRFSTRLDHNFTTNNRTAVRFTKFDAAGLKSPVGGDMYTTDVNRSDGGISGVFSHDWVAKPTLLFNFRAGATHNPLFIGATNGPGLDNSFLPEVYRQILGPNRMLQIRTSFMGDLLNPAGSGGSDFSFAGQSNIRNSTTYDFGATGTKFINNHTLKFGFEHRRYYDNFTDGGGGDGQGSFNQVVYMINQVSQLSGDNGLNAPQGRVDGLGGFLLGINSRNQIASPSTRAMKLSYNALFLQDDWKVNSRLTLNLGLRYDREGPVSERTDKLYVWDADQPSLFSLVPGYNFAAELAKANLPATAPVPRWVGNGFQKGAILLANSKELPTRTPQRVDNGQFAPRIGLAFQVNSKTVVRAYGGLMYLPTTGSAGAFSSSNPALPLSPSANAGWHASDDNGRNYISTWTNPFPRPSMLSNYSRDTFVTNQQSSADPGSAPFNRDMHMPREYTWAVSVQHELPHGFVVEGAYTGNRGLGLLSGVLISNYPVGLLKPEFGQIMGATMASPTGNQTLANGITGPTQQLGLLQYDMPYYGNLNLLGSNIGSSTFHAMHLRAEKRMANGFSVLANYTFSRLLDNVGGPEAETLSSINSTAQGAKNPQTVLDPQSVWGLSTLDQTHRFSTAYIYEIPVGKGKRWMGTPSTFAAKTLDAIIGGWGVSGYTVFVSGKPVRMGSTAGNINNGIKVNSTFGSYTTSDHNLANPQFDGDKRKILVGPTENPAGRIGAFDRTKVTPAQYFVLGSLPGVDPNLRHPGFTQTDLSLMKSFILTERTRLQFRSEFQNAFNIRGYGQYNTTVGDLQFGLIRTAGNAPRQIQLSLRLTF
jgi:hypothetical protein